jgi:hypothetical protein
VAVAGDAEEDREIILGPAFGNRATEVAPFRAFSGTITPHATRRPMRRTHESPRKPMARIDCPDPHPPISVAELGRLASSQHTANLEPPSSSAPSISVSITVRRSALDSAIRRIDSNWFKD